MAGKAFIPAVTEALRGLWRVNQALLEFLHKDRPAKSATLDMDATLIETHKRDALHCYKKNIKASSAARLRAEQTGRQAASSARDSNPPVRNEQARVMKASPRHRTTEQKSGRAPIRHASRPDRSATPVRGRNRSSARPGPGPEPSRRSNPPPGLPPERRAKARRRPGDGKSYVTDQEWAEVVYVPNWAGHSRRRADYRFLAIREPLRQLELGDEQELPFPTQAFAGKGLHKLFGVVANRKGPGDGVMGRCESVVARARRRNWR